MKKIKKQTVYNLSPVTITAGKPEVVVSDLDSSGLGLGEDVEHIITENSENNPSESPAADSSLVPDNWTIAGITWEKKKWFVILVLLTLNLITLAAVAFKRK
jgi:hypothetical protein